ncbi:MAG: glutathione S-transferase family protein [Pseudomonadota bacterium]
MMILHYAPDNASLVLRLALEEIGVPYQTVLVDRASRAQKAPDYLALNPCGIIPTLETPEGPLAETGACLLWLSDAHPVAGLGLAVGEPSRGAFLRWLFFLSNTVHADLIRVFYPARVVPPEAVAAHHDLMVDRLCGHLSILEEVCRAAPALFAPPSALALYLGPLLRWSALYPRDARRWLDLDAYRALRDLVLELEARPSVAAAIEAEGLGPTPFSAPRLPQPPEGSAT